MLFALWRDNPWIVGALSVAGVVATFALGGPIWGVALLILVLLVALVATANSLRIARSKLAEDELRIASDDDEIASLVQGITDPGGQAEAPKTTERNDTADSVGEDWFSSAFAASWRGDVDAVTTIVEAALRDSKDDDERNSRQALGLVLKARAGSASALSELLRRADDAPSSLVLANSVGLAYSFLGDADTAAREIRSRATAFSGEERAELLRDEARYWLESHRAEDALAASQAALALLPPETGLLRRDALKLCAKALRALERVSESFAMFEQALAIDPTDKDVRFELAYFYAEQRFSELAILHYQQLISQDSSYYMAVNNLGVELRNVELPLPAFEQQRKAAENGVSLAASNLAATLIEAGAGPEAQAWLDRGLAEADVNPRVQSVAAHLSSERTRQRDKVAELTKEAAAAREALRELDTGSEANLPEGSWRLSTGEVISLESVGDEGKCKTGAGTWTFTKNGAVLATSYAATYAMKRSGFAFARGETLCILLARSGRGHEFLTGERIDTTGPTAEVTA